MESSAIVYVDFNLHVSYVPHRKKTEDQLLTAKIHWELTFDSVPDLIAILDDRHRVVRANRAMAERLGMTPDQCIGLNCYRLMHGTQQPPSFCPHALTCRDGLQHIVEVHEPHLGGDFLVSTTPLRSPEGEIAGSVHVARDITERKKAEEALKSNNERLRILSDASNLLLSTDAPETTVQTIAGRVMSHLGCDCFFNYLADEDLGRMRLNAFAGISQETAREFESLDGEAVSSSAARDSSRLVFENVLENDSMANYVRSLGIQAYVCQPLKSGTKTIGTLSFGTRSRTGFTEDELDLVNTVAGQISVAIQRKRADEYLKQRTLELEAANEELASFSYTVSHDLRAPLRSMDGYSRALLEDYGNKLDERSKSWLENIRTSSQTMGQLINDILTLSRVVRTELKFVNVDLSRAAIAVAEELKKIEPNRQVDFIISPDIMAWGDVNLLKLALENLLGNAFKFTSSRKAALIEFGSSQQGCRKTYFVRDSGVGFDMKHSDKLFTPFQRLHNEKEFPGTGIGLATVQRIIKRHGGEVWAEGEEGKGATFHFTLNPERIGERPAPDY